MTVTLSGANGDEHWNETTELPVRPASARLTTGGELVVGNSTQTVDVGAPGIGGADRLTISVGPRPTLALPRAIDALYRYPYGCAEQTVSSAFPLVALADLGEQIAPEYFKRTGVAQRIDATCDRLLAMQNDAGWLGCWYSSGDPWHWASIYAAHFCVAAEAAKYQVPERLKDGLLRHCRRLCDGLPNDDSDAERMAYAAYVLALAGTPPLDALPRLDDYLAHGQHWPAIANFAACAWAASGHPERATAMLPAELPAPRGVRALSGNVGSPVRDQALLVATLCAVRPDHPALPRLAQRLADDGLHDHWYSTQDTAFAAWALGAYARTLRQIEPLQRVELWVDGACVAAGAGDGSVQWVLTPGAALPTRIEVRGSGAPGAQAYLSWVRDSVPLRPAPAADHGLVVRRRYLDAHGEPFTGSVPSGALVQVELTLGAATDIDNVVIEDLLPAGFDPENARFDTSAKGDHVSHPENLEPARVELRDDRALIFTEARSTQRRFVYLARATAPGTYIAPPVRAECMYDVSMSSVSETGTLVVTGKP